MKHQLWWDRGKPGRGILWDDGQLDVWNEDEFTHVQMGWSRPTHRPKMLLLIRPDGTFIDKSGSQGWPDEIPDYSAVVNADRRLRWKPDSAADERTYMVPGRTCAA
jgi:hypothetical protein